MQSKLKYCPLVIRLFCKFLHDKLTNEFSSEISMEEV